MWRLALSSALIHVAVALSLDFSIERIKILGDRPLLLLRVSPVDLAGRHAVIATGIGLHNAGVDGEGLALDQAHRHGRPHHALEDVAQQIALAEATQPVLRERRVVRNLVLDVHLAKPAIRQVQLDFLVQLPFRADAVAVADDEHPDHQLRIDRGTADVAVMGFELLVQVGERHRHEHVHAAQQVVLGNAIFKPEFVEQAALMPCKPRLARLWADPMSTSSADRSMKVSFPRQLPNT